MGTHLYFWCDCATAFLMKTKCFILFLCQIFICQISHYMENMETEFCLRCRSVIDSGTLGNVTSDGFGHWRWQLAEAQCLSAIISIHLGYVWSDLYVFSQSLRLFVTVGAQLSAGGNEERGDSHSVTCVEVSGVFHPEIIFIVMTSARAKICILEAHDLLSG